MTEADQERKVTAADQMVAFAERVLDTAAQVVVCQARKVVLVSEALETEVGQSCLSFVTNVARNIQCLKPSTAANVE